MSTTPVSLLTKKHCSSPGSFGMIRPGRESRKTFSSAGKRKRNGKKPRHSSALIPQTTKVHLRSVPDGQTLIFTACEMADGSWGGSRQGVGSCDLFYAFRKGEGWSAPQNIGQGINTGAWESQPSYSADGQTLYFVRGKRSAKGIVEQDIYYCYLNDKGQWSSPQKVPGKVNTDFQEESVMIHPDGRPDLYFSSNGHPGMGGLEHTGDRLPDGSWDRPVNLGYPINTFGDER